MNQDTAPVKKAHQLSMERADGTRVNWDLTEVIVAEGRGQEVARVTPVTAPELMATFNSAHARACTIHTALVREHDEAVNAVKRLEAQILLDEASGVLEAKGLSSSADLRKAVVQADLRYQKAVDRQDQLKAMVAFVKLKADSINRSYSSVKALLGERAFNYSTTGLSAGASEETSNHGYGTPNYGRK